MCHDMEWMTRARLHVLWYYNESRQQTGEDSGIVSIRETTLTKTPFRKPKSNLRPH